MESQKMEAQKKSVVFKQFSVWVWVCCASLFLTNCGSKAPADLFVYNGHIQTVDRNLREVEAMAIKDGKILAIGSSKELREKFSFAKELDLHQQYVYPGLNDAHCHFYGLGTFLQQAELTGSMSMKEVVERCKSFNKVHPVASCLRGRGWDQNLWHRKEFPDNELLNKAFPLIPVLLKRIDGHAAIANNYALHLAGINAETKVYGGEIVSKNGEPTGVLVDAAVEFVEQRLPKLSRIEQINALINAEKECLQLGLTSITDAGLEPEIIDLIDSLQGSGELRIRINAMVSLSRKNLDLYARKGPINKERLQVNSFKMYADGALGSRGACMKKPYNDRSGHFGFLLIPPDSIEAYIKALAASKFQLNTHCIGDSANHLVLQLYARFLSKNSDRRWRIEHAQVVDQVDLPLFKSAGVIPSVQPTHATSDMNWAVQRIGDQRINDAYRLKSLLNQNGWIPLGTDFPVEPISAFYTFYAAVERTDANGNPKAGFHMNEALTRSEALRGITVWPAMAAFEENVKGTLEVGKYADFIILSQNLMKDNIRQIREIKQVQTFIHGVSVN